MAIHKKDAQTAKLSFREEEMEQIEKRIDRSLTSPFSDNKISISVSIVPFYLRSEVERRYRAAGWTVTYCSDQRDGDFWVFE
jgi:predicted transposase YdaD